MSYLSECAQCCECEQPIVQWDSSAAFKNRCTNYYEDDGREWRTETTVTDYAGEYHDPRSGPLFPQYQVDVTRTGAITRIYSLDAACGNTDSNSGEVTWSDRAERWDGDDSGNVDLYEGTLTANGDGTCTFQQTRTTTYYDAGRVEFPWSPLISTVGPYVSGCSLGSGGGGSFWLGAPTPGAPTYSDEVTPASLRDEAIAALPALDGDFNDPAGSYFYYDGDTATVQHSEYRLAFPVPHAGTRTDYRVRWVERFIPDAGVALSSIGVYSPGVYRPTVTIAAPDEPGVQAVAIAVMASNGAVASIHLLNHGSGYTTAPTVTVETAINGGTTSTGWTASVSGGRLTSISGGGGGDYLPVISFAGGGLGTITDAVAVPVMDSTGGIASVSLSSVGSGYSEEPTLIITPKCSATAADLLIQLGTETTRCEVWGGTVPPGYDEGDSDTWPTLTAYALAVPEDQGATLVANVRAVCAPGACPP